jgi:hypothetical protein
MASGHQSAERAKEYIRRDNQGKKAMNTESVNFIKDYVLLLQENYNESLAKINEANLKGEDSSFYQGQNFAYYAALDLIKSQLEAFGYNSKEITVVVPEFGKPATVNTITNFVGRVNDI